VSTGAATLTSMGAADLLDRLRAELTAVLAPPACLACRAPLADAHAELCVACRRALPWLADPCCPRCGLPAPCGRTAVCPARAAAFERAWAPLAHAGPARQLVAALKFRGALPVARLMAAQIAATAPRELLAGAALVPVPPACAAPGRRRVSSAPAARRAATPPSASCCASTGRSPRGRC
jgi:predicted amidophosphoribosyltransferase